MPKKTLRELQKSKFLTVVNEDKGTIDKIVAPNNFQIGTDENLLPSSLSVYGRVIAGTGLSGSLTTLKDGTSYLIAGENVTITSQSNGSVTISAIAGGGGGGSISVSSGSLDVADISEIIFDDGLFLVDNGDNTVTVTSTIGEPEDGTYQDGLYTDFTPDTSIGVAIDRFNEILKLLAPSPAPSLDDIDANVDGIDAFLSFGASNNLEGEATPYYSVNGSVGIGAVDVNGLYETKALLNDLRIAIFDGSQNISGDLNEDVPADGVNYPANSFGDGDLGALQLELNGTVIHTIDLTSFAGSGDPGAGTGESLNGNGSGFTHFSVAAAGTLQNGTTFENFKHRTGRYLIDSSDQRDGWNYARVLHVIGSATTVTNYVEWVNDSDVSTLNTPSSSLVFAGNSITNLSGVKYYTDGSATYQVTIDNAYRNVYDNNDITFTTSIGGSQNSGGSFSLAAQSKPIINTGGGEDHTKSLSLTAIDSTIGANYMLNGSLTAGVNVTHPLKSNISNAGQATASGILLYNLSNNSTSTTETFRRENYRILSGSYDSQSDVSHSSNIWDSDIHMTGSNVGYNDGLQFFNQSLYSPTNTINSGDFTSFSNAPGNQPDYSSQTGLRTFYRWFKNETGSTKYDFSIQILGSGTTIVSRLSPLNSTSLRVFVKFPDNGSRQTGWLDLAQEFVLDQIEDDDGAHISTDSISFDNTLDATNYVTFGTVGIQNNEYICLKIEADESWVGQIDQINISFGAGTGTVSAIPDLDDIDCNDTGVTSKLSFGTSKPISGYENVGTTAGFSATDLNGIYQVQTLSNNLRRATFDGSVIIEGDLNEDVPAITPDYVANSFSDANSGSLVLEVNGVDLHTVDLTGAYNLVGSGEPGSGTGTSFTGNSGFFDLSVWRPAQYDNEIPNYLEVYRTGKYRVHTSDQVNGWNYLRVKHIGAWGTRQTNYVEWVNDTEGQNINISSTDDITQFGDDTFYYSSGVSFFTNPTGSIKCDVDNVYKNVYSSSTSAIQLIGLQNANAVSISQKGLGLLSQGTTSGGSASLRPLSTTAGSQNETLNVSGLIQFSPSTSLSGSFTSVTGTRQYACGGRMRFVHPLKGDYSSSTVVTTNMLVYTSTDSSNQNTNEYFTGEAFRLQRGSYDGQDAVANPINEWDSEISINDNDSYPSYSTGLMVYDTLLISPFNGGDAGNFRNKHETSDTGVFEGPDNNVNYSTLFWSDRDYFRAFLNNTTNDRPSITVTLYGDASLVGKSGANYAALGSNKNINVEVKIPDKTGFLDLGKPSAGSGNISDGDGCLSGNLNATISSGGTSNVCTFNGQTVDGTVSGAEYIVLVISAHKDWTGYLSRIDIAWS